MIIYYDIIIRICFNTNTNSWNIYFLKYRKSRAVDQSTVGGITHICFKQWFQITADVHPGVSKDQKFCEKYKNTRCQADHLAKIE